MRPTQQRTKETMMKKCNPRMSRAQKAVIMLDRTLEEVRTLAATQGYKQVEFDANRSELGPWYRVVSGDLVLGTGNTWTACLNEAMEYLKD
jgi:hypothetical protein